MKKRIISLLLAVLIVFSLAPAAFAATKPTSGDTGAEGDNLHWSYSSGTLTISGQGDMLNYGDHGYEPWGDWTDSITKVVIKDGVTSIGSYTFAGHTKLTSVTIPSSVRTIGEHAFWCCSSLLNITIPNGVISIGTCAFRDCESLANVSIPSSVTMMGDYPFLGCLGLRSITVASGNTAYASKNGVLYNKDMTKLLQYPLCPEVGKSFTIPSSVKIIGESAFQLCAGLTSVTIPDSVTTIEDVAFAGCDSLTNVTIPSSVTSIGEAAFADTTGSSRISFTVTVMNSSCKIGGVNFYAFGYPWHGTVICHPGSTAEAYAKECGYAVKTILLNAPKNVAVSSTATGIKVTWNKVTGAEKYRIFYKPAGGSWATAGYSTGTSYTWTGAKAGTTYQIRVWCVSSDGKTKLSDYDGVKTITYKKPVSTQLPAPKNVTVSGEASGIKVTWSKVTGAEKYRIFYKPAGGSWATAGYSTGTSYTWTGAKVGTTYQIRVWCVTADGKTKTSDYDGIRTIKYLSAPKNVAVSNTTTGIKVTWNAVSGAERYRIFYKPSGGSWATAGYSTGTSYIWTGAKAGTTYQIRVWCVSADGKTKTSAYDSVNTITYQKPVTQLPAPKNVTVSGEANGIKVTWSKVAGAVKYRIFYKPAGGSWATAGYSTGTSYTWTGAKSGTTYQIRVWCVTADGKTKTSDYDGIRTIKYLSAPKNVAVSSTTTGIKVTWNAVSGAERYRIFYKPSGGSWATAGYSTGTSYTWTGAKSGTTYQIRVWCVSADGKTKTSAYDGIKTITYKKPASTQLPAPTNVTVSNTATGIKVTWNKVAGAVKYRIFYRPSGGSWATAGYSTGTSYTWTGAKSGTTYQIRVWCVSADGKTKTSDYDGVKTIKYLSAPKNVAVSSAANGIKVTWSAVTGAAKYRIFYKPSGGSWATAGYSTGTSYTWTGAKSGTTYQIRVWCVSSDGKTKTSDYDGIKTITYQKPVTQLPAPKNVTVSSTTTGIKVTWSKVTGAEKYRIFYKPSGGSWATAGYSTGTSYTWTGAKDGTTYQIRVWCVTADGKTKTSDYDGIKTITYKKPLPQLAAPKNVAVRNTSNGIKVSWSAVPGAEMYRVSYMPSDGIWTTAGDTSETSYTWTGAKVGTTYQIRVWCITADSKAKVSGYDTTAIITYTPKDEIESRVDEIVDSGTYYQDAARSMLPLINQMRTGPDAWYWNEDNSAKIQQNGLGNLTYDYALEQIAMRRAAELVLSFAHTRPNGTSCFTLEYNGVTSWAENIAYGYTSVQSVFNAWAEENDLYSGQGHRRNMLDDERTAIGIACFYYNGTYYWVQEFGFTNSGMADPLA